MKDTTKIRRAIWRLAPKRLYQFVADIFNALVIVWRQGLGTYIALRRKRGAGEHASVNLKGIEHPIFFRPGTEDANTIIQNLIRHEYGCFEHAIDARSIIDAGAFIGDASIFFLNRFPQSTVIALEPNDANYALAEMNLRPYGARVHLMKRGIWSEPRMAAAVGSFTGSRLVQHTQGEEGGVECVDVPSLMADYQLDSIDILKLDVEGAEGQVLTRNCDSWLPKTKLIIVEFHGRGIEEKALASLRSHGFGAYRYRSLYYCYNKSFFSA